MDDDYTDDEEQGSTVNSQDQYELPTLADLVTYLVASKRSLSSVNHVYRANEIVATSARSCLEDITAYRARNTFLSQGLKKQLLNLQACKQGLEMIGSECQTDFEVVLENLDDADVKIKDILGILKTTQVDPSFHPEETKPRCLFDFVDEAGVDTILATFRDCIDQVTEAQDALQHSNAAFGDDITAIEEALSAALASQTSSLQGPQYPSDDSEPRLELSDTPAIFHSLEDHATEMAELLQSLMKHYDLCVKALRHTEGGGEAVAAEQERSQLDPPLPPGMQGLPFEHDAPQQSQANPMSDDERAEMLQVLQHDAPEVPSVVSEISSLADSMEAQLNRLRHILDSLKLSHVGLKSAASLMAELGSRKLLLYVEAGGILESRWKEQKAVIEGGLGELEGLREFYEGFVKAYGGLTGEVRRRRRMQEKVEAVAKEAMRKIERLYEDDIEERGAFRLEHGEFLPSDIWPDLMREPLKYEIRKVANSSASKTP